VRRPARREFCPSLSWVRGFPNRRRAGERASERGGCETRIALRSSMFDPRRADERLSRARVLPRCTSFSFSLFRARSLSFAVFTRHSRQSVCGGSARFGGAIRARDFDSKTFLGSVAMAARADDRDRERSTRRDSASSLSPVA